MLRRNTESPWMCVAAIVYSRKIGVHVAKTAVQIWAWVVQYTSESSLIYT